MMIVPMKMATAMIMTEDHRKRLNSKQRSGFVKTKKNDNDSLGISSIDDHDYSDDGDDHDGGSPETAEFKQRCGTGYNSTETENLCAVKVTVQVIKFRCT